MTFYSSISTGKLRILYLSSIPARPTTSSAVILHRHVRALSSDFEWHAAHDFSPLPDESRFHELQRRPAYLRACNTRLFSHIHELNQSIAFSIAGRSIDEVIRRVRPHVLLTLAEGWPCAAAWRAARRHGLPLVSIFHDWAPGWIGSSRFARGMFAREFVRLYHESTIALGVCPEILARLGPHANAHVLYPIPEARAAPRAALCAGPLIYAGVYRNVYRVEIETLARTLLAQDRHDYLRICGPGPHWDDPGLAAMQCGMRPRHELQRLLASAGALLVISPFSPPWDFISRYSFPSKIPFYCPFGKPLLLWAPEHAASTRWARATGAAKAVTSPDPAQVLAAFVELRDDPASATGFAERAAYSLEREFSPAKLQTTFETALRTAARHGTATLPVV